MNLECFVPNVDW